MVVARPTNSLYRPGPVSAPHSRRTKANSLPHPNEQQHKSCGQCLESVAATTVRAECQPAAISATPKISAGHLQRERARPRLPWLLPDGGGRPQRTNLIIHLALLFYALQPERVIRASCNRDLRGSSRAASPVRLHDCAYSSKPRHSDRILNRLNE
jgi:hypothetical protein